MEKKAAKAATGIIPPEQEGYARFCPITSLHFLRLGNVTEIRRGLTTFLGLDFLPGYGTAANEPALGSSIRQRSLTSSTPAAQTSTSASVFPVMAAMTSSQAQPAGSAAPEASPVTTASACPPTSSPEMEANPQ